MDHNKYLVYGEAEDEAFTEIKTAREIFDMMDMDDCYPIRITGLYLIGKKAPVKCEFHGTWHNGKQPLLMTITKRGKVIDSGYGTDH